MIGSIYQLVPDIFVELPGCPEALIKQHLRLVAREFCRDTEAYRIKLDPIDIEDGTIEYNLQSGCNGSIHRILWVKIGENVTDENDKTEPVDPSRYMLQGEYTLVLMDEPTQDITDGLLVYVVLRPDFNEDMSIEPWFIERYADRIAAGTKYRLMRMTGKRWSDPAMAKFYYDEYDSGVSEAKGENFRDYRYQDIMMDFRRFSV